MSCHNGLPGEDDARTWPLDPARSGDGPIYDIDSRRIDALNFLR
jgi:hypothetical protein